MPQVAASGHAAKKHGPKKHTHVPTITIPGRPKPREEWYKKCPPWGHGGDGEADLLKNRIDRATHTRTFTATQFLRLPWPKALSRNSTHMADWSRSDRARAFRYEGMAASVVGYLVAFNRVGPRESCNCGGKAGYDWHLWIAKSYRAGRKDAIISEATPRVRAREHGFSWKKLASLAGVAKKVRVTGWVFLDNDHQLGKTDRATLWEIHPITRLDVFGKRGWAKVAG